MKLVFTPFSIIGGLLAGLVAKKIFEQLWALVDDEEPPEAKTRETSWPKLLIALAIEGAIFRATKGFVERSQRAGFYRLTGSWPGEERPDEA